MEYVAISKNVKMSPRKVRLIVDSVKKSEVPVAINYLSGMNRRAAIPIRKTLESALANAVNNFKIKKEDLVLKDILVEEGIVYKRYHYAGRGRIRPYKKRTSHIRVILEERTDQPVLAKKKNMKTKSDKKRKEKLASSV